MTRAAPFTSEEALISRATEIWSELTGPEAESTTREAMVVEAILGHPKIGDKKALAEVVGCVWDIV